MTILVDALPTKPDDCLFSEYVQVVSGEVLDEAEYCEDCGGIMIEEGDVSIVWGCKLTAMQCALEVGERCDCLAYGYVTRF